MMMLTIAAVLLQPTLTATVGRSSPTVAASVSHATRTVLSRRIERASATLGFLRPQIHLTCGWIKWTDTEAKITLQNLFYFIGKYFPCHNDYLYEQVSHAICLVYFGDYKAYFLFPVLIIILPEDIFSAIYKLHMPSYSDSTVILAKPKHSCSLCKFPSY